MLEQFNAVFYEVLPVILAILVPSVFFVVRIIIKKLTNKLDAETQSNIHSIVMDVVQQGVDYADKWAEDQKRKTDNKPYGSLKSKEATAYILDELKERGITDIARDSLLRKIESKLGSEKKIIKD